MTHAITKDEFVSAEEGLIADVQVVIHNLMEDRNMSRADLARALGVSDARVSQMFSDSAPNLTLRTMARVFRVLGEECRITCDRWEEILAPARPHQVTAEPMKGAKGTLAFDFESMLRALDRVESTSQNAYSNDNPEAALLAA